MPTDHEILASGYSPYTRHYLACWTYDTLDESDCNCWHLARPTE